MNSDRIDDLLKDYARQPLPPEPARTNAAVWSEIRRRREASFWSRLLPMLEWRDVFAEPRLAFPALALAMVIGVLPALAQARWSAHPERVRQSLHFDVFSTQASSLPGMLAVSESAPRTGR